MTLTYTEKECTEVIVGRNGMVLSKESNGQSPEGELESRL